MHNLGLQLRTLTTLCVLPAVLMLYSAAYAQESVDDLFGDEDDETTDDVFSMSEPEAARPLPWLTGFLQNELAYAYTGDSHFSKWKNHLRLITKGNLSSNVDWQVSGHIIYDPIFELDNFYPDAVEDNQKFDGWFHETFLDISLGNWEIRLGRQNIVWGEAVGLFFADVISALNLREFILPDFEIIRIPQWAGRAEYYNGNFHAEFVFIPQMTTDKIGEPGAEFYPFQVTPPPGFAVQFVDEKNPRDFGGDFAGGTRLSYSVDGWDLAGFYYTSPDKAPAFQRQIFLGGGQPVLSFRPIHERIHQFGGTLAKGLGDTIIKAEMVYTADRLASVTDFTDADGLTETDEIRWLLGADYVVGQHTFNAQIFQTRFLDHKPTMIPDDEENGFSLYHRSTALHENVETELLWIRSLNRNEWLLEAKVSWVIDANWRAVAGVDVFDGPNQSIFGQYDETDRVYYELRYSF